MTNIMEENLIIIFSPFFLNTFTVNTQNVPSVPQCVLTACIQKSRFFDSGLKKVWNSLNLYQNIPKAYNHTNTFLNPKYKVH